jgi:hypothetical protein
MSIETGTIAIPIEKLAGADARHALLKLKSLGFWVVAIYPKGWPIKTKTGTKLASGKEPIERDWAIMDNQGLVVRLVATVFSDGSMMVRVGSDKRRARTRPNSLRCDSLSLGRRYLVLLRIGRMHS